MAASEADGSACGRSMTELALDELEDALEQEVMQIQLRESEMLEAATASLGHDGDRQRRRGRALLLPLRRKHPSGSSPSGKPRAALRRPIVAAAAAGAAAPTGAKGAQLSAATAQLVRQQAALTALLQTIQSSSPGRTPPCAAPAAPQPPARSPLRPKSTQHPQAPPPAAPHAQPPRQPAEQPRAPRPSALPFGPELARLRVQAREAAASKVRLCAANDALRRQIASLAGREAALLAASKAASARGGAARAEAAAALALAEGERAEARRLAEENAALRDEAAAARDDARRLASAAEARARKDAKARAALERRAEELEAVVHQLRAEAEEHERCDNASLVLADIKSVFCVCVQVSCSTVMARNSADWHLCFNIKPAAARFARMLPGARQRLQARRPSCASSWRARRLGSSACSATRASSCTRSPARTRRRWRRCSSRRPRRKRRP